MSRSRKASDRVVVDGHWFAIPTSFLTSRACAELSPLACKMFFMLMGQVRSGHFGNGRLDAHENTLRKHGWTSMASARAAIQELLGANLLVRTRMGSKGRIGLYAISLFPMHCNHQDLEVGPGAWTMRDWRERPGVEAPPTSEKPAVWARPRANEKRNRSSRDGSAISQFMPAAGGDESEQALCNPVTGVQTAESTSIAHPQRVTPLRNAICQGKAERDLERQGMQLLGKVLRLVHTSARLPTYRDRTLPAYFQARAGPGWPCCQVFPETASPTKS